MARNHPRGRRPANLTPHPRSSQLAEGINRCQPVAWSKQFIRCTGTDFANKDDLITGDGSLKYGGRYSPIGAFQGVYGSLELDTATGELMAYHRSQGRPDPEAGVFPFTAVSLEAKVERMLDLMDAKVRRALKVSRKVLTDESWQDMQDRGQEALTQAIGRLAREAGFQGILFPSAVRPRGKNLILFPDKLSSDGLRIIRKDKLASKKT